MCNNLRDADKAAACGPVVGTEVVVVTSDSFLESAEAPSSGMVTPSSDDASIATTPRLAGTRSNTPNEEIPDEVLPPAACLPKEAPFWSEGDLASGHGIFDDDFAEGDPLVMQAEEAGVCPEVDVPGSPEPEEGGLTDEEIVAMLAECAGAPSAPARVRPPSPLLPTNDLGDLQIMSSLEECAGDIYSAHDFLEATE